MRHGIVSRFILCLVTFLGLVFAAGILVSILFGGAPEEAATFFTSSLLVPATSYYLCLLARIVTTGSFGLSVPPRIFAVVLVMLLSVLALDSILSAGLESLDDSFAIEYFSIPFVATLSTLVFAGSLVVYRKHYREEVNDCQSIFATCEQGDEKAGSLVADDDNSPKPPITGQTPSHD